MTRAICLWSGPRNVSTALMYSFAQHNDVRVVDEPLYGHYLRVTDTDHPGKEDVLAAMNCDGNRVVNDLLAQQEAIAPLRLFLKNMTHHLVDIDLGFLTQVCNVFLIRDPREMLPSLTVQLPRARLRDTGLRKQWHLYEQLAAAGQAPVVLDSRELLLDPAGVLQQLCAAIGLDYDDGMLRWPAGPRAEDGVWAPHWYHAVHQSTGFAPYVPKTDFPVSLVGLLDECAPWYERLFTNALRADPPEPQHARH